MTKSVEEKENWWKKGAEVSTYWEKSQKEMGESNMAASFFGDLLSYILIEHVYRLLVFNVISKTERGSIMWYLKHRLKSPEFE